MPRPPPRFTLFPYTRSSDLSTEVASCTFEEQRRVLAIAEAEVGGRLPLVNGVWADGSLEAARIARMAAEGGASARSEEHTSELQSHSDLVCRLLLEKKKRPL